MEAKTPNLSRTVRIALIFAAAFFLNMLPQTAFGQSAAEEDLSGVRIEHTVPPLKSVWPGSGLVLQAFLKNTRQTGLKMRCFFARDGKLLELPLERSFRNEYDVPTYEFKTAAPLSGATYYFVLYRGTVLPLVSERFVMLRECNPSIDLTDLNPAEEVSGEKHLQRIRDQARGLEKDLVDYENVLGLIKELQALLGDQK